MKELSIEQKAKRYDDLLVRLQDAKVDNDVCDDRYCCVIDNIVPELEDSRGARIIKVIRGWVLTRPALFFDNGISKEEILEWLEKQSETFTKKDVDDAYLKGISDAKQELEKQGEQPTAWSEEDELKRSTLIHVVKKQQGSAIFEGLLPEELIDWLKSLRPQKQWKPSEE